METRRALAGGVLLLLAWWAAVGCREEVPPLFRRNRAPETTLTIVAEDFANAFYRYHVYWRGEDPDGQVVRFLFAITDTLNRDEELNWDPSLAVDRERGVYTTRNDSIFLFNSKAGRQVFNIVAIDDYGELDPSPARSFFRVVDNGLPFVDFLGVTANTTDPRVLPCAAALPCTVPMFTSFQTRFVGRSNNGAITGYTWQPNLDLWEPYYTKLDTFFLQVSGIQGDTTGYDPEQRLRWHLAAAHDTVTVYTESSREKPVPAGDFSWHVRVRDQAKQQSLLDKGHRLVTVNYDPDTRLFSLPECDCPHPPANCSPSRQVPVGFITGIGLVDSFPRDEWRVFCPGDTLPNLSRVRFFAQGEDDDRDPPIDPESGRAEARYRFRFEYGAVDYSSNNMNFSDPEKPASDLIVPPAAGGGTYRGADATWRTCPLDYKFEAGAVDENDKVDGTPAAIPFYVSGTPQLDSLEIPKVLVFIPKCPDIFAPVLCPWSTNPPVFGPDTLAVVGTHIADPTTTPLGLGYNDFTFPFRAWGHDHPRDLNPPGGAVYYNTSSTGILSWIYTFDCSTPNCADVGLRDEGNWHQDVRSESDPPGQQVYDDVLRVRMVLDTVCVTTPCTVQRARAVLNDDHFGTYVFTLQGRDTDFIGQTCDQPSDLGQGPAQFPIPIYRLGRTTQVVSRQVIWRQYQEVRRLTQKAGASAGNSGPSPSPFALRKRWMP